MKKIFFTLFILLGLALPTFSAQNVMPETVSLKDTRTIGVYQASDKIVLYEKPDATSNIIHSIRWNAEEVFPSSLKFQDLFIVFIPSKELALMAVTDELDGWVEVIYNNTTGDRGWMQVDDPYKFMTWINFYNMYGKKYGLYILKGAPDSIKDMKGTIGDNTPVVARMNIPRKIQLNVLRGNWALVSVLDLDRTSKTGYVHWRSTDGVKYMFPDIK